MAVCLSPLSGPKAELTLLETIQDLREQLAKSKQDLLDLRQNFLLSEATAYALANHLQKNYTKVCEKIIESGLQEKLKLEGKLADESVLTEKLKKCSALIQRERQHVLNLNQKLQEGRDISCLVHQKLKDLLTREDLDNPQGQVFGQKMSEIQSLVEQLIIKLSLDNKEGDHIAEEAGELFNISMNMEEDKNFNETLEEDFVISENMSEGSSDYVPSDIEDEILTEHHTNSEKADEDQFYASSPTAAVMPNRKLGDEEQNIDSIDEVYLMQSITSPIHFLSSPTAAVISNSKLHDGEENIDSIDEVYLMHSITYDTSLPCWPYIFNKKSYKQEVSTLNTAEQIFEVFFRSNDPIPKLEHVDFLATNSTHQVHGQTLAFGGIKQSIKQRKLLNSKWRIACKFPGLQA